MLYGERRQVQKADDETELTRTVRPSSPLEESLVFRSKPVTEASKRLEQQIEVRTPLFQNQLSMHRSTCLFAGCQELVAGVNATRAENVNSRKVKSTAAKPEQTNVKKKFEKKKQERLRYEKILSSSMEGFVTRSAVDKDMDFTLDRVNVS